MERFTDAYGRNLRLTDERGEHVERRPEMVGQIEWFEETLADPHEVRSSTRDDTVWLYYREFPETPVTEKHLLVVARIDDDPFVITAFFSDRIESGEPIDQV